MTVEELRRLKHLSEMPTHSQESLEELKELVRMVTVAYLDERDEKCRFCIKTHECHKEPHSGLWKNCYYSEHSDNFELRMEEQ